MEIDKNCPPAPENLNPEVAKVLGALGLAPDVTTEQTDYKFNSAM